MVAETVLVTGGNRGVGLGIIKELLKWSEPPQCLIATCRDPAKAEDLSKLGEEHTNLHVLQLDVKDREAFPKFVEAVGDLVGDRGLNVLFNNAGILSREPLGEVTYEAMMESYEVNTVCPLLLIQQLLPLIRKASQACVNKTLGVKRAAIINMSTKVASLEDNTSGRIYAYRCSKVAQNMMTRSLSHDLAEDGILCACLHPGWVQTEMGGPNALITVEQSSSAIVNTLSTLNESHQGTFFQFDGKPIPW